MSKTTKTQSTSPSESGSFRSATGPIPYTLKNDLLFHYVMSRSNDALKGLICTLKNLNPDEVRSVTLLNPIDYGYYAEKEIIFDIKVEMNNSEIIEVELQLYFDKDWEKRSLLYLCRAFDSINSGDEYSKLKPATMVVITERAYMPHRNTPEFYSEYELRNVKNNEPYSSLLRLNVLYLDQADLATQKDKDSGLLMWSNLFKATTWEELNAIAAGNHFFEEVADCMYTANIIDQEKTYLEGHQRFLDQKRGAYGAGYDSGIEKGEEIGAKKHLISSVCQGIKNGIDLDDIRKVLSEDSETITRIYNIALKYTPDFDCDKIFSDLNSNE